MIDNAVENKEQADSQTSSYGHETLAQVQPNIPDAHQDDNEEPSWWYDEGIPGKGEKPEWFNNGTFKNVMAQAKQAVELRKALGERSGAPEEYSVDLGEGFENRSIDKEDGLYQWWDGFCKDSKCSNELYNNGIKAWFSYIDSLQDKQQEQYTNAVKSMGLNAEQTLGKIENWFTNSFPDDSFSDFKNTIQSERDIKRVLKMIDGSSSSNINVKDSKPSITMDRDYWRKAMSPAKGFGSDIPYTNKIQKEFNEFVAKGGKLR